MKKVYLAGGMHNNWRETIKTQCPGAIYFDPTMPKLQNPADYTAWDLAAVAACDLVFAYMDHDNPSGYGMSLEIGYALASKKPVILVDEKLDSRMEIVRQAATFTFGCLESGVDMLFRATFEPYQRIVT